MKKTLLLAVVCGVFVLSAVAQVNKITFPSKLSGDWMWSTENTSGTFTLANEGNAIKVLAAGGGALAGKFQYRFTPSEAGEYVLKFKAKAENAAQTIRLNILRCDQWSDMANQFSPTLTTDWAEYTINFTTQADKKYKTPSTLMLEIFVNGVSGSLWFEDIRMYEASNNLIAYQDDFETDKNWGNYNTAINSWQNQDGAQAVKATYNSSTVLKITQDAAKNSPWDSHLKRHWWAQQGVKYRVKFDAACNQNFNQLGLEVWNDGRKIRPTEMFNLTSTMQTFNLVTAAEEINHLDVLDFYTGKIAAGMEVYLDNVMISPIHLYNATVEFNAGNLEVEWLSAGYLAGDKLKIELVKGETVSLIADNVEVIGGMAIIDLNGQNVGIGNYFVRITDKVSQQSGANTYSVYNVAETATFSYGLEIAADANPSSDAYVSGDIVFESNESSTGQLTIPAGTMDVIGKVHIKKTFTEETWYPMGFPFEITSIRGDFGENPDLYIYNPDGSQWGDFYVKFYNGDTFEYTPEIVDNTGYIFLFPTDFIDAEVTFSSEANPELKNLTEGDLSFASEVYTLLVNPSVKNLTLSATNTFGNYYYIYKRATNNFARLTSGTAAIQPFESFVAVKGVEASALRSSLNIDDLTGLKPISMDDSPIVATQYYNLQGVKIAAPASGGVFIMKTVYQSGAISVSKIITK